MINLSSILLLGFVLGLRHATDPDHVIAVTTIVSRERSVASAAAIGAIWGIGHTVTLVLVGGAIVAFGVVVPPRLGLSMELSVAVMLVLLGLLSLRGASRTVQELVDTTSAGTRAPHSHAHAHGDYVHNHVHRHETTAHGHFDHETALARLDARFRGLGPYQTLRPLIVGLVHGLAGSAAVALLVMATIPGPYWAVVYLLVFGAGTILGMTLITIASALPFAFAAKRSALLGGRLRWASGLLSLALGLFLIYRIGFVDGLFFSAAPSWTPS